MEVMTLIMGICQGHYHHYSNMSRLRSLPLYKCVKIKAIALIISMCQGHYPVISICQGHNHHYSNMEVITLIIGICQGHYYHYSNMSRSLPLL